MITCLVVVVIFIVVLLILGLIVGIGGTILLVPLLDIAIAVSIIVLLVRLIKGKKNKQIKK